MTTPSSRITKIGGNTLLLKAFVTCKTEPPTCFSCQIDILWVVPILQIGAIYNFAVTIKKYSNEFSSVQSAEFIVTNLFPYVG